MTSGVIISVLVHDGDLYEMIPGFAVGFTATIGVSLATSAPEGAEEEMACVSEAVKAAAA